MHPFFFPSNDKKQTHFKDVLIVNLFFSLHFVKFTNGTPTLVYVYISLTLCSSSINGHYIVIGLSVGKSK